MAAVRTGFNEASVDLLINPLSPTAFRAHSVLLIPVQLLRDIQKLADVDKKHLQLRKNELY